jgi:hypothetical protein
MDGHKALGYEGFFNRIDQFGPGHLRRVVRGGSWNNNDNNTRARNRNNNAPANTNNNNGLRCARRPQAAVSSRSGRSSAVFGRRERAARSPVARCQAGAWVPAE